MRILSTKTTKALCSGCGTQKATTSAGMIIQHDRWSTPGEGPRRGEYCPGAGKPPQAKEPDSVKVEAEGSASTIQGDPAREEGAPDPAGGPKYCEPEE